ncbi:MAG TPA: hypothetical protein VLC10_03325 [Patescibacteria group bacterium]|nr:hypothetical protein [Patescibacteria group bacterium]
MLMTAVGGLIIGTVQAAAWQGPTQAAPGGNIPGIIWNRVASGALQTNAAISIDGGGPGPATATGVSVGASTLDLGSLAAGENMIYGVASYAGMNAGDYLIKLQTFASSIYTDRFRVDKNGAVYTPYTITAGSNIASSGVVTGSGGATFGSTAVNLGSATVGQNLIYGLAAYANMHPTGDFIMKLQTYDAAVYTDRLTLNRNGDLKASGCFGKTFAGLTASVWPGNIGSYYAADNKCGLDFPGSHVCKVDEMLESIQCSIAGDPIRVSGGSVAWINGGPPGDPSKNANDCIGWTDNTASSYGRVWIFDNTTGGRGTLTGCNVGGGGLKYACCR